jgi:fermentation-respiration switch protein FrsA (DUF1100 family)
MFAHGEGTMERRMILAILGIQGLLSGCISPHAGSASGRTGLEEVLVFQPQAYPQGYWLKPPGVEDVWFRSPDGVALHGWFAAAKQPRAVVLFMHGNGGNLTDCREVLQAFRDGLNTTVLVFDYRGYGRSEGKPSEAGVLADARAARHWLAAHAGVAEGDVVLVGHSLGGGVAVDLAAHDGARGLVLENTFTSLPGVAWSHFPLLPFGLIMHCRLDSLDKIASYHGPLLMKHGDDDEIVPFALGKKLFAAANEPKRFIAIPGGKHNDPATSQYLAALDEFLSSLPAHR